MADNITLNANTTSGAVIATDDIGGVQYPITKISFGALNTATAVETANPLPVTVISQPANSALAAGTNVIGKVTVDQTTPGTTDSVTVKTSGGIGPWVGALTETAPASDTASSGLNGRLQRIAQNITSLIAQIPATLGIKTAANSLSIAPASDAAFKLAAGTAIAGQVGIDQTTDGTTNAVSIKSYSGTFSNATTTAYAASLVVKASAGKLIAIKGYNAKTSTQFIQIHDSATLPADGAVPVIIYAVPASSNFELNFHDFGRSFTTGIVVCNSSTGPTKTIGAADLWVDARFS